MSMRMRTSAYLMVLAGLVGCTGASPLATFGQRCSEDADCESGACAPEGFCTEECSEGSSCGLGYVCGTSGLCVTACPDGSTQGAGADRQICVDGFYVACSSGDAASTCSRCGCEPFGGGTCVAGSGCVIAQPDGSPCTTDIGCTSGACHRDTGTCGPPRAIGEPCTVDAECETGNCSTDGDPTTAGVCNQELGSECTGFDRTETCTNCLRWDSILPAVCAREHCGPGAECPQLGDSRRVWSCEQSTDGAYRCYEQCNFEGSYNCFDGNDFCRSNGFCG